MEKRAAEMDLALAPERQRGRVCDVELRRWVGGSTGQGWLGCVGAVCGGCAVLCGSLHCLRCVYDSHATASDPLSGLRCRAARHRESGCNILIVSHLHRHYLYASESRCQSLARVFSIRFLSSPLPSAALIRHPRCAQPNPLQNCRTQEGPLQQTRAAIAMLRLAPPSNCLAGWALLTCPA